MSDERLRAQLADLLDWRDAHVSFDDALSGVPEDLRGRRPSGLPYSIWELLEHMRICQADILDFCTNPRYVEMPAERYYPQESAPASGRAWEESLEGYRKDRTALKRLAKDASIDLFSRIPHGSGQTYLRELVLVADHNAYTLGQILVVRRLLGIWK